MGKGFGKLFFWRRGARLEPHVTSRLPEEALVVGPAGGESGAVAGGNAGAPFGERVPTTTPSMAQAPAGQSSAGPVGSEHLEVTGEEAERAEANDAFLAERMRPSSDNPQIPATQAQIRQTPAAPDGTLPAAEPPGDEAERAAAAEALQTLVNTQPWEAKRALLERDQAVLISIPALYVLRQRMVQAEREGNQGVLRVLGQHFFLLRRTRQLGITAAWAELEELHQAAVQVTATRLAEGPLAQKVLAWLKVGPTYREQRRYLEAHQEIVTAESDVLLGSLLFNYIGRPGPGEEGLRTARTLLRNVQRLQATDSAGDLRAAIRVACVNAHGGLVLDISSWLEESILQFNTLNQSIRPAQTYTARVALLRIARDRAHREALPQEIPAELAVLLSVVLDGNAGLDRAQTQDDGIACLMEALEVYTREQYPVQFARAQNGLGVAYAKRLMGDRTENLERAIACFEAALQVRTPESFPIDYANLQINLAGVYYQRHKGQTWGNLERAIACAKEALRMCTVVDFPDEYAAAQTNLGEAYRMRRAGDREENMEQAIAAYQEALRVYTLAAFPATYAQVQNNLGIAYANRLGGVQAENMEQAITCFHEALRVYTFDADPFDYAMVQNNLGNALRKSVAQHGPDALEQAIAAFEEALRVRTLEGFPEKHRETQVNRALAAADLGNWSLAEESYRSALAAEDLLVAISGSIASIDATLEDDRNKGRDAATGAAYALARLDRLDEAVVAAERGRARSLAEALAQMSANPAQISDPARRARYMEAREVLRRAQAAFNTPLSLVLDASTLPVDANARRAAVEAAEREAYLARSAAFAAARQAFDAVVEEVRQAGDPGDFLLATVDVATILRAAQQCGTGHALVYLVPTPRGGLALAALDGMPDLDARPRVAALDLPRLTSEWLDELIESKLADGRFIGGFGHAQERRGLALMLQQFPGATLRARARALRAACAAEAKASALSLATEALLAQPEAAPLADAPLDALTPAQATTLEALGATFDDLFLQAELMRCLPALADAALRPLSAWLDEQDATGVTLIPSGSLAAFSLAGVEVAPGVTFGDRRPTSVAPSARALLLARTAAMRSAVERTPRAGLSSVGDPRPTHQVLRWAEAEALTLTRLARELGLPAEARTQGRARRAWLVERLHQALVIEISCHGGFNTRDPLDSALQLAGTGPESRLTLRDMLSHAADLRGLRLLILSACQLGILDLRGAVNEVRSLAVGTLQAGALATVAASWAVDDCATYLLIVRFAQEWLPHMDSLPPAVALARAQAWLRAVTVVDLRAWRATEVPPVSAEERQAAAGEGDTSALSAELETEEADATGTKEYAEEELVGARKGGARAVRGRGSRYDVEQAEERIRVAMGGQPDEHQRPYANPIYWAGFQVYGW